MKTTEILILRFEVPSRQLPGSNHHGSTDQAVLILGLVASEKFKLLPAPYAIPSFPFYHL